ncbi:MAG: DUF885 domain-containing protein [Theionarchaea archaeon]|nr:DUF885 domain-containing protein [Theionarchaea archaeon]MBU7038827.1 DUF885 domain-containing protein [Theionarchaea archaeon]
MALVVVLALSGCIGQSSQSSVQSSTVDDIVSDLKGLSIDEFFDASFKQLLLRYPEWVTALGISEEVGLRNNTLNDLSDEYIRETQELESAILRLLREYDRSSLTEDQQISYDTYEWYLDDLVRGRKFMYYNYPIHHFLLSYHDELIRLFTEYHTLTDEEDCEDYVARLSSVDTQVAQLLTGLKKREELGVIPPTYILTMTRQMLMEFLGSSSRDPSTISGRSILFYTYFADKVEEVDLSDEERDVLREEALKAVEESVLPAYADLLEYVEYLETVATSTAGVWRFPEGDEYYQYMLRHETSTVLTPEEIHQMGLAEVDRIQQEMREVFDGLGYPQDESMNTLIDRAIMERGFINTYTQSGKEEVISTYEDILDDVDSRLDEVFDIRPAAELIVVGEPSFGGGGGFYVQASLDGSRPGAFHTGIGNSYVPTYRMPTIAYHEAIPGHYFQISIAQELDLPLFRRDIVNNGFVEGWALYAEQLVYEMGLYEDDPYGNIGRLHMELLRAVRLVADTGIHYKQWTREEARAYMKEAMGNDDSSHEVDRYIVLPAQATGYMVGKLKMLELRQKAMDELGDAFNIKEFHHVVLSSGGVPLTLLEKRVEEYIDSRMGATIQLKTCALGTVRIQSRTPQLMSYFNTDTLMCTEFRMVQRQQ